MIASNFVQVYPRELTPGQIHHGVDIPVVRAAQEYSYGYGLVAHAALRDEHDQIPPLMLPLRTYEETVDFHSVEGALLEKPGGWDHRNEVNFPALNEHMGDMWDPLILGEWPKGIDRNRVIHIAMNSLAIEGLLYYTLREKFVRRVGTEALYEPYNEAFLSRYTGVLQEIDVAIVILDVIRKNPNLTVVPAPMQFERSKSGANADLLVVDLGEKQAMGVQTKTVTRRETREKYDQTRIALVDGTVDLGNVRVVRTKKGRSTEAPKPWPGIVAASRVDAIKLHGKNQYVPSRFSHQLLAKKMLAREMVGSLRVDHRDLSKMIAERIMSRLYG